MINLKHATTLAVTKLRTRRIRLIVTLIVSGLLFTVLVAGSLITRGTLASLQSFANEGYTGRFFVAIYPAFSNDNYNPAYIKRAQEIEKATIAKKTAEAKRLGIPYDSSTERKAVIEGGPEGPKQLGLDNSHPAAIQALRELAPKDTLRTDLEKLTPKYGIKKIFQGSNFVGNSDTGIALTPIVDGKEIEAVKDFNPSASSLASFASTAQTLDTELVKPLALKGADLTYKAGEPVPILAPIDAVEKLAGLTTLSTKATPAERLQRLKDVREKAKNITFTVCYRNGAAGELAAQAKAQTAEIEAGKGKADYVAPTLQYATSPTACAPTAIKLDKRTAAEKALAAKQVQFETTFGIDQPQTTLMKFRIVGVLPKIDYGSSAIDINAMLMSFVSSSLGNSWYIPEQAVQADPLLTKINRNFSQDYAETHTVFPEFTNRAGQKRFIDEHSCTYNGDPSKPNTCPKEQKYNVAPYGNPLAALYDAKDGFMKFLRILLLVIAGMTAVIMMGTIGKIIADSRKETSVFRAVGANRLDIAEVYLLYAAILASLAFGISLVIGIGIALWVDHSNSAAVSVQAILSFNSPDTSKEFHFFGLNILDLLGIFAFAVGTGLISAIPPLLTNLSRNPIKDMREE